MKVSEETRSQVAISRKAEPVTPLAEVMAHGGDDPDRPRRIGIPEVTGWTVPNRPFHRLQVPKLGETGEGLLTGEETVGRKAQVRRGGHELNEANVPGMVTSGIGERRDLVVVFSPDQDHIDLDGLETASLRRVQTFHHPPEGTGPPRQGIDPVFSE